MGKNLFFVLAASAASEGLDAPGNNRIGLFPFKDSPQDDAFKNTGGELRSLGEKLQTTRKPPPPEAEVKPAPPTSDGARRKRTESALEPRASPRWKRQKKEETNLPTPSARTRAATPTASATIFLADALQKSSLFPYSHSFLTPSARTRAATPSASAPNSTPDRNSYSPQTLSTPRNSSSRFRRGRATTPPATMRATTPPATVRATAPPATVRSTAPAVNFFLEYNRRQYVRQYVRRRRLVQQYVRRQYVRQYVRWRLQQYDCDLSFPPLFRRSKVIT